MIITHQKCEDGFSIIELMIVMAILAILASIAIPNFIAYRNMAYCTETEERASGVAAAIAEYFATPSHAALPNVEDLKGLPEGTYEITGDANNIEITAYDASGNCPLGDRFIFMMPTTANGNWQK